MKTSLEKRTVIVITTMVLGTFMIHAASLASNQGQAELFAKIAGDYELDLGDRGLPFSITLKEGKLYFDAQVAGLDPEEMKPVEGEALKFSSIDPNGDEVVFTFKKDDAGKITGCTVFLPNRGMEAEAVKKDQA